jgi:hypothetical protein
MQANQQSMETHVRSTQNVRKHNLGRVQPRSPHHISVDLFHKVGGIFDISQVQIELQHHGNHILS